MLEIGFGHKIPRLDFVSHLKISQENLRKKSYDQTYHKKVEKSGKTLISSLMYKIPYFRVFPLFGGIICQMILFSNFLSQFLNGKHNLVWIFCGQTLFQALYLEIKPLKSTLAT